MRMLLLWIWILLFGVGVWVFVVCVLLFFRCAVDLTSLLFSGFGCLLEVGWCYLLWWFCL